jgi:hypothetical protein
MYEITLAACSIAPEAVSTNPSVSRLAGTGSSNWIGRGDSYDAAVGTDKMKGFWILDLIIAAIVVAALVFSFVMASRGQFVP